MALIPKPFATCSTLTHIKQMLNSWQCPLTFQPELLSSCSDHCHSGKIRKWARGELIFLIQLVMYLDGLFLSMPYRKLFANFCRFFFPPSLNLTLQYSVYYGFSLSFALSSLSIELKRTNPNHSWINLT